jgi:RNA polymerase sigma factor for flagellar operon FliA
MALEEELVTEVTPGPDEAFARQEELRALRVAIDGLSDRHRTIVIESFFEGRTMREIGDDLGVTESRVSQLRSAALATLRSHLTSH